MDLNNSISKDQEDQTNESGIGEESSFSPPFSVGVSEVDTNESTYVPLLLPAVNTSQHQVLQPPQDSDGHANVSSIVLQESSPHPVGGGYSIQYGHHDSCCTPELQELLSMVRKVTIDGPNWDPTFLIRSKFLIEVTIQNLNRQFAKDKYQLQKLEGTIRALQVSLRQKEVELEQVKQEMSTAENENKKYIKYLDDDIKMLKGQIRSNHEEACLRERQIPKVNINSQDREQLAKLEQQVNSFEEKIRGLEL